MTATTGGSWAIAAATRLKATRNGSVIPAAEGFGIVTRGMCIRGISTWGISTWGMSRCGSDALCDAPTFSSSAAAATCGG
jgi:hypothetical protein